MFVIREGEDFVGLMPMFERQGAWKTLRAVGTGSSDYLHPIARQGYERHVGEALTEALRGYKGADLVDLHQIREDKPFNSAGYVPIEQARCLVLSLPSSLPP